jgi:hypothetical protein
MISPGSIIGETQSEISLVDANTTQNTPILRENSFDWFGTPMVDLQSKKPITINELALSGKTVIIHTFAVWCPSCTNQLGETTRLQYDYPDKYSMIAIDIDPNEDESMVLEHILSYAFKGNFVKSPVSVSRSMIRDLGTGVTLALPQTIIINDGVIRNLGSGIITESEIRNITSNNSV